MTERPSLKYDSAVKRLSGSGMTPEQVSRKTSIPLKKVEELLGG